MAHKNQNQSQAGFVDLCTTLSTGLQTLPDTAFAADGGTVVKADAVAAMNAFVQAAKEVESADAAYLAAKKKRDDARIPAHGVVEQLVPYLKARFGRSNPALETTFGIKPDKVRTSTVAHKAAGAAKGAATKKRIRAAVAAVKTAPAPAPAAAVEVPAAPAATTTPAKS